MGKKSHRHSGETKIRKQISIKAYGVFQGGGMKGAALAGCVMAAEEHGIEFVGVAGSSAGSIVALLCSLRLPAQRIKDLLLAQDFATLLDDDGRKLDRFRRLAEAVSSKKWNQIVWQGVLSWRILRDLAYQHGLYDGGRLTSFLRDQIIERHRALATKQVISFRDLEDAGSIPLKVVTTDIRTRAPRVFLASPSEDGGGSVVDAIRASSGFPFVFKPVEYLNSRLIDGGLSSNLPLFAFDDEIATTPYPVLAFGMTNTVRREGTYSVFSYAKDLLGTALDSGDKIQRQLLQNVHQIDVPLPEGVHSLDFAAGVKERGVLFQAGYQAANRYFLNNLPAPVDVVEGVRARHAPEHIVSEMLRVVAGEIERNFSAKSVRTAVMLPTFYDTRIVTYHHGMTGHADHALELPHLVGASGKCWTEKQIIFAENLRDPDANHALGMTPSHYNLIPKDRSCLVVVPILDPGWQDDPLKPAARPIRGTLSADTSTPLSETKWQHVDFVQFLNRWADILSQILF